jgi:hypothetical protein
MSYLVKEFAASASKYVVRITTDEELGNPVYLFDARAFAAKLRVPRRRLLDYLADGLRDSDAELEDEYGNAAQVDFELLELDGIEDWFKDWVRRPAPGVLCRVRAESRERIRVLTTILRLIFPKETSVWGSA